MDKANDLTPIILLIVALAFLAAIFPIIIAYSKSRGILQAATFILCFAAIAGAVALGAGGGFASSLSSIAVFGSFWTGSLLCGIAALLDARAEDRANELIFRMLKNDGEGIRPPERLAMKYRN